MKGEDLQFSPSCFSGLPSPQILTVPVEFSRPAVPILKEVPTKKSKPLVKNSVKKTPIPSLDVMDLDKSRSWNIVSASTSIQQGLTARITNKTRCEEPCPIVPDILYSSLKYEIRMTLTGNFLDSQFILGRISVVDTEGKIDSGVQLLKGLIECACTRTKNGTYEGTFKSQFVDCSYHHKKGDFCWQIDYFFPHDLTTSILTIQSAPFKVFARKPTKEKRKNTFDDFTLKLDELLKASKKLKSDEKTIAMNLVTQRFSTLDPNFNTK